MIVDHKEYQKKYYQDHKEELKARSKDNYQKNKAGKQKYYSEHREQLKTNCRIWYHYNKEYQITKSKKRHQIYKKQVFDHYGWVCSCCGESIPEFLTIDHINGGGNKHRKQIGGANMLYLWLIQNDFPENFRTLCYNCNMGRRINPCPHEKETYLDRIGT